MRKTKILTITLLLAIGVMTISNTLASDTIVWHSSVKDGSIFGWKCVTFTVPENHSMTIGDQEFGLNSVLQFEMTADLPTDPSEVYESDSAPNWVDIYLDGTKIPMSSIGDEGEYFMGLVLPISYTFENGTALTFEEFLSIEPDNIQTFSVESSGDYFVVTMMHTDEPIVSYKIHKTTGIAAEITAVDGTDFEFKWTFLDSAANVGDDGETQEIEDDYNIANLASSPGFEIIPAIFLFSTVIYYKKRR